MDNIEDWKYAGKLAAKALSYGRELVRPGASVLTIATKIEEFIRDHDALPAFPVNISINEIAAHYSPTVNDTLKLSGKDVIKLDVGVVYNSCIGDTATTVDLSGKHSALIEATKRSLEAAISAARPGVTTSTIGKAIEQEIKKAGFHPIKNLGGHQLSENTLHGGVFIPNFADRSSVKLYKGQIIAIEPFAAYKSSFIYSKGAPYILQLADIGHLYDTKYHQILRVMEKYKDLPFSIRWLMDHIPPQDVVKFLSEMDKNKLLTTYQPLLTEKHDIVVQEEHTIIVDDEPVVLTTF